MRYCQRGEKKMIGATGHDILTAGKRIVIDWGLDIETLDPCPPDGNYLAGEKVDILVLTHYHLDHIGAVARFVSLHPEIEAIFATTVTMDGTAIMLWDGLKIQEGEIRRASQGLRPYPNIISTEEEIMAFLADPRIEIVDEPCWITPWEGWEIGFYPSGHTTGAISVFIIPPDERPIYVTGDISSQDQEIAPGVMLPPRSFTGDFFDLPELVMVSESTNGSRDATRPYLEEMARYIDALRRVEARGGQVLCPSFAANRASRQVLIMAEAGIVPHVDGMAREFLRIEIPHIDELINDRKVILFENDQEGHEHRELAVRGECGCTPSGFSPIVAPSATMEFGHAVTHARRMLARRENAVFFTGHMFEGTVSKALLKTEKGRTVHLPDRYYGRLPVPVACEVNHFDFTSHDYRRPLAERIRAANPEHLILHHSGKARKVAGHEALMAEVRRTMLMPPRMHYGRHMEEINVPVFTGERSF